MKKNPFEQIEKNREKIKEKAEEVAKIAKLGKEAFKNVTLGKGDEESLFLLGFIAGYQKKEKELKQST